MYEIWVVTAACAVIWVSAATWLATMDRGGKLLILLAGVPAWQGVADRAHATARCMLRMLPAAPS